MIEEEIIFEEKPQELLEILSKEGSIDESDKKGYKINYFGEKTPAYFEYLIKNYPLENLDSIYLYLNSTEDTRNFFLYIKYKDIYIGGVSIFDFQSKEGFGMYKYLNLPGNPFYLGQWDADVKSGIGFLRMDKNHFYLGNFNNNQMEGEGIYYNKQNCNYFYGNFNNGNFKNGIYTNLKKDIYYIGEFKNNKKNDNFCCFFNRKKHKLFFGQIQNDLFIKGHIIFLRIKETTEEISINIEKIIYYDRTIQDDSKRIILKHSNKNFEEIVSEVLENIEGIKQLYEAMTFFDELKEVYSDTSYNNRIGRYNSYENEYSFENDILDIYNNYIPNLKEYLNNMKNIKKNFKM